MTFRSRRIFGFAALTLLNAACNAPVFADPQSASANLEGLDGASHGNVVIAMTASGTMSIVADLSGLPEGVHGFHIHETGTCDVGDGFKSAGGHLAGDGSHGIYSETGKHPGDLPNIHVPVSGRLQLELFAEELSFKAGMARLNDMDGSAVVIHSGADDYRSQPSGDAGERIACGVLKMSETNPDS